VLTSQFADGEVIDDGIVIVTLHHVRMESAISMGFEPVGAEYTITKSYNNRLCEVDGREPFGETVERLKRGIESFVPEYLWYVPVVVLDESNEELLTLRTFKTLSNGCVEFFGPIKEGRKIRLTYAESDQLLQADRASALKVAKRMPNPDFLLNFSCIGRQYVLEDRKEMENRFYIEAMPAPLFGFFTFGEIGPSLEGTSLQFFNETSLLTAIREL
jgi:hypothetical protein